MILLVMEDCFYVLLKFRIYGIFILRVVYNIVLFLIYKYFSVRKIVCVWCIWDMWDVYVNSNSKK